MELRWIDPKSPDYREMVELRRKVLRIPLGLDFTPDQLSAEAGDPHLVAIQDGRIVGCLLLTARGEHIVQMRQVAVVPELQGSGIGALMVVESERKARELGFARMILHARDVAVGFYERLGYGRVGEPFIEVSIPHQEMGKPL
jgi:N-acetylglutamate synthase-like GNAT family acetyltransferase